MGSFAKRQFYFTILRNYIVSEDARPIITDAQVSGDARGVQPIKTDVQVSADALPIITDSVMIRPMPSPLPRSAHALQEFDVVDYSF